MTSPLKHLEIVVLAAGKGTRMKSQLPKVLHRLCGQSLLERVLRSGAELSPKRIVVVAGYGAELLESELERLRVLPFMNGIEVLSTLQEEQKGTGHAASIGLEEISPHADRVLILPGDSPLLRASDLLPLLERAAEDKAELTFLTCIHPEPAGFGRILRNEEGSVLGIIEQKDCSEEQLKIQEINTSIYLGTPSFFRESVAKLDAKNAQGELYLTDVVAYAVDKGIATSAQPSTEMTPVLGANNRFELNELELFRRAQINRAWMEAGVSMENPASTYIDEGVTLGTDCYLGAGTRLRGDTVIENDVCIEGDSLIKDSHIGTGTEVRLACQIVSSKIGAQCTIGPFAHLRPGSFLWEKVKVGNFVETKKAELHNGVKASHLSYLGDVEIGGGANIGAGTITCNYDGVNKHKTKIGGGVFIGSNSALVAPVEIGEGAYVGAGSTITQSVPAGSLGVARGQQRNIDGWVARKKLTE